MLSHYLHRIHGSSLSLRQKLYSSQMVTYGSSSVYSTVAAVSQLAAASLSTHIDHLIVRQ